MLLLKNCTNRARTRARDDVQCVDPTILVLPDGRKRMFFVRVVHRVDPAFSDEPNQFRSAMEDGKGGWIEEEGVRFSALSGADPDVILLPDQRWRMFYTGGLILDDETGNWAPGIMSAISTDGIHFEKEPGVRVHRCSASASMVLGSGHVRLFCHTRDVFWGMTPGADPSSYIVSHRAENGLDFEQEDGVRVASRQGILARWIGASAPSLMQKDDGSFSLMFTTVAEPLFPWNWLYLKEKSRVFQQIEEDLAGRAEMGSRPGHGGDSP